jgi:metal transporter CNNM
MTNTFIWLGIVLCLSQSATLSGLNLAVFSLSRLRLESAAGAGDKEAARVLALRRDANYTLSAILWANVAVNVLLALLADSVLAGVLAFLFSTVVITVIGEIMPQAYFSRNALRIASRLAPLLRAYRVVLWPLARPSGLLLDAWIGPEGINWLREKEIREVLRHHARDTGTEVSKVEATGAINFLALDDLPVGSEGEPVDPRSIVALPFDGGLPLLPEFSRDTDDPFLRMLQTSGRRWVVIVDESDTPRLVLDAHAFLRDSLFGGDAFDPMAHTHEPLVVTEASHTLGRVLGQLQVFPQHEEDDVVDYDVILVWDGSDRRIITGSDILGRLLRGIVRTQDPSSAPHSSLRGAQQSREPALGKRAGEKRSGGMK